MGVRVSSQSIGVSVMFLDSCEPGLSRAAKPDHASNSEFFCSNFEGINSPTWSLPQIPVLRKDGLRMAVRQPGSCRGRTVRSLKLITF